MARAAAMLCLLGLVGCVQPAYAQMVAKSMSFANPDWSSSRTAGVLATFIFGVLMYGIGLYLLVRRRHMYPIASRGFVYLLMMAVSNTLMSQIFLILYLFYPDGMPCAMHYTALWAWAPYLTAMAARSWVLAFKVEIQNFLSELTWRQTKREQILQLKAEKSRSGRGGSSLHQRRTAAAAASGGRASGATPTTSQRRIPTIPLIQTTAPTLVSSPSPSSPAAAVASLHPQPHPQPWTASSVAAPITEGTDTASSTPTASPLVAPQQLLQPQPQLPPPTLTTTTEGAVSIVVSPSSAATAAAAAGASDADADEDPEPDLPNLDPASIPGHYFITHRGWIEQKFLVKFIFVICTWLVIIGTIMGVVDPDVSLDDSWRSERGLPPTEVRNHFEHYWDGPRCFWFSIKMWIFEAFGTMVMPVVGWTFWRLHIASKRHEKRRQEQAEFAQWVEAQGKKSAAGGGSGSQVSSSMKLQLSEQSAVTLEMNMTMTMGSMTHAALFLMTGYAYADTMLMLSVAAMTAFMTNNLAAIYKSYRAQWDRQKQIVGVTGRGGGGAGGRAGRGGRGGGKLDASGIPEHHRPLYSLDHLLHDPAAYPLLLKFLQSEWSSENALFILEVEKLSNFCRGIEAQIPGWQQQGEDDAAEKAIEGDDDDAPVDAGHGQSSKGRHHHHHHVVVVEDMDSYQGGTGTAMTSTTATAAAVTLKRSSSTAALALHPLSSPTLTGPSSPFRTAPSSPLIGMQPPVSPGSIGLHSPFAAPGSPVDSAGASGVLRQTQVQTRASSRRTTAEGGEGVGGGGERAAMRIRVQPPTAGAAVTDVSPGSSPIFAGSGDVYDTEPDHHHARTDSPLPGAVHSSAVKSSPSAARSVKRSPVLASQQRVRAQTEASAGNGSGSPGPASPSMRGRRMVHSPSASPIPPKLQLPRAVTLHSKSGALPLAATGSSSASAPPSLSVSDMHTQARLARDWCHRVSQDFLVPNALYQVNIPFDLAISTKAHLEQLENKLSWELPDEEEVERTLRAHMPLSPPPPPPLPLSTLFTPAAESIFALMEADSFRRFMLTPYFDTLLLRADEAELVRQETQDAAHVVLQQADLMLANGGSSTPATPIQHVQYTAGSSPVVAAAGGRRLAHGGTGNAARHTGTSSKYVAMQSKLVENSQHSSAGTEPLRMHLDDPLPAEAS